MGSLDKLMTIPIGSLLTLPEQESDPYFKKVAAMPDRIKNLMTAFSTGAFIRGVAAAYNILSDRVPRIAIQITKIAVGEKRLAQLPSLLSTELKLPNDKAQAMAREIEEDLFGPVRKELEEYWRKNKIGTSPFAKATGGESARQERAGDAGARNVLNLKDQKKPPVPPPMLR